MLIWHLLSLRISIHAPAKGATRMTGAVAHTYIISIHAPAKGATQVFHTLSSFCCNFNPRSREGSDNFRCSFDRFLLISIHAPAKGATLPLSSDCVHPRNFNPRSREGSDLMLIVYNLLDRISIHAPAKGATGSYTSSVTSDAFQSTLPRRERL